MQLPPPLRAAVDTTLTGVQFADLQRAAGRLSARYRAEIRDGWLHLDDELAVKAYLATRLPATYAAVRSSFEAASECVPGFEPKTLLDIGAGPGTALWAAADCWPSLERATLLEASAAARAVGASLANALSVEMQWLAADVLRPLDGIPAADLVTMAYVLDELPGQALTALIDRLWERASGCLIVVEPGTPAGWTRILGVRDQLIASGAYILAPCPHAAACPLRPPDWCHFSRKVARSRLHRLAKGGDVPWEDEKFIYVAASRTPASLPREARVIAPPRIASGQVRLKLCEPDGTASERLFTKRDAAFRAARRVEWGDTVPHEG